MVGPGDAQLEHGFEVDFLPPCAGKFQPLLGGDVGGGSVLAGYRESQEHWLGSIPDRSLDVHYPADRGIVSKLETGGAGNSRQDHPEVR